MPLPEQIKSQIRWLAENLDRHDAEVAACVLADEILSLVSSSGDWRTRATVEHERQVILDLLIEAYKKIPFDFGPSETSAAKVRRAIDVLMSGSPLRGAVISIDRDRMTDLERVQAQEQLIAALVQLGSSLRTNPILNGEEVFEVVRLVPPPEFRQHFFGPTQVCLRCGSHRINTVALPLDRGRVCPGTPTPEVLTPVQGINRGQAELQRQAEQQRYWLEGSRDPDAE